MGNQDRGRAPLEEEPVPPLATINVSEFDIYQTKRNSLFFEVNVSICEPTRLRVISVESVTKQPNQKLQQTKSLALAHLVIDGGLGEKSRFGMFGIMWGRAGVLLDGRARWRTNTRLVT
jgi:hypothetical protein